jgi:non-specific protein-tyrosine kinase
MTTSASDLDLRALLAVLWRRKWIIIVALVVTTAASVGLSVRRDPVYQATADVVVQPRLAGEGIVASERDPVFTEIRIMESSRVVAAAQEALGYLPDIDLRVEEESEVVGVRASEDDPDRAREAADAYAQAYVDVRRTASIDQLVAQASAVQDSIDAAQAELDELIAPLNALDEQIAAANSAEARQQLLQERDQLEEQIAPQRSTLEGRLAGYAQQLADLQLARSLVQTSGAEIISSASTPTSPVSPKPVRDGVLAAAVGLVLGVGIALVVDRLDDTISSAADVENLTGLAVIASIPRSPELAKGGLLQMDRPSSGAEAIRVLRTSLEFIGLERDVRTVLVTSPNERDGKTSIAANLAVAAALTGRRVCVVSGDLRRPKLHTAFDVSNAVGFTSVLLGSASVDQAVIPSPTVPNLRILPAGPSPPNPAEILASNAARALFRGLTHGASLVVLDGPPVLPVADSLELARIADGVLLVARSGVTSGRQLRRTVALLEQVDAEIVGVVLNGVGHTEHGRYYSHDATKGSSSRHGRGTTKTAPPGSVRYEDAALLARQPLPRHGGGDDAHEDPVRLGEPGVGEVRPEQVHGYEDEHERAERHGGRAIDTA